MCVGGGGGGVGGEFGEYQCTKNSYKTTPTRGGGSHSIMVREFKVHGILLLFQ